MQSESGERPRRLHRWPAGKLHPDLTGSMRADGGDVLSRRGRPGRIVRNRLALDWPQYSKGKFETIQREAEHAGQGMWAGSYVEPWLYRVGPHPNDDLTVKNRLQIFVGISDRTSTRVAANIKRFSQLTLRLA